VYHISTKQYIATKVTKKSKENTYKDLQMILHFSNPFVDFVFFVIEILFK